MRSVESIIQPTEDQGYKFEQLILWPIQQTLKFNENLSEGSGEMAHTRKCYRRTDEGHSYNPLSASEQMILK